MPPLTRAFLHTLQQATLPIVVEAVPCPELGEDMTGYVRMMSSGAAEAYERQMYKANRMILDSVERLAGEGASVLEAEQAQTALDAEQRLRDAPSVRRVLVIQTFCDAQGDLLLTMDDEPWIKGLPAPLVKRLFDAAWTLNALGDAATAQVEEEKKDFAATANTSSGSNSPEVSTAASPS